MFSAPVGDGVGVQEVEAAGNIQKDATPTPIPPQLALSVAPEGLAQVTACRFFFLLTS